MLVLPLGRTSTGYRNGPTGISQKGNAVLHLQPSWLTSSVAFTLFQCNLYIFKMQLHLSRPRLPASIFCPAEYTILNSWRLSEHLCPGTSDCACVHTWTRDSSHLQTANNRTGEPNPNPSSHHVNVVCTLTTECIWQLREICLAHSHHQPWSWHYPKHTKHSCWTNAAQKNVTDLINLFMSHVLVSAADTTTHGYSLKSYQVRYFMQKHRNIFCQKLLYMKQLTGA